MTLQNGTSIVTNLREMGMCSTLVSSCSLYKVYFSKVMLITYFSKVKRNAAQYLDIFTYSNFCRLDYGKCFILYLDARDSEDHFCSVRMWAACSFSFISSCISKIINISVKPAKKTDHVASWITTCYYTCLTVSCAYVATSKRRSRTTCKDALCILGYGKWFFTCVTFVFVKHKRALGT
jgi:hypothetical protein